VTKDGALTRTKCWPKH